MMTGRFQMITGNTAELSKAERIIGYFLYDRNRTLVARIDGIIVRAGTHRALYLVIAEGGFLATRGKTLLVPMSACEVFDLGEVRTGWTLESLQDAPSPHDPFNLTDGEEALIADYFAR